MLCKRSPDYYLIYSKVLSDIYSLVHIRATGTIIQFFVITLINGCWIIVSSVKYYVVCSNKLYNSHIKSCIFSIIIYAQLYHNRQYFNFTQHSTVHELAIYCLHTHLQKTLKQTMPNVLASLPYALSKTIKNYIIVVGNG